MIESIRPVLAAARYAVQDISEPYDGYHVDLVDTLTKALAISHSVPGDQAQRRAVEELVKAFAREVSKKLGESQ